MVMEGGKLVRSRGAGASSAPLFTIITAVLNGAKSIERAIQSVDAQSFRDFEFLVLDAASRDGTVSILERFSEQIDYWRSEPDRGIYSAWNQGIGRARGEWIAFLGADDEYYPDALQNYAQFLSDPDNVGLQYASSRVELVRTGGRRRIVGKAWKWQEFCRYMNVAHVGSMHRRALFEQFGQFDETYQMCADYEFLLRPGATLRTGYFPIVTARMALGGVSNARPRVALAETARAKVTTGGRPAWRCALEYHYAVAKSLARAVVG
jgi:glycosyltransferase involved in cell wall biosynthesis